MQFQKKTRAGSLGFTIKLLIKVFLFLLLLLVIIVLIDRIDFPSPIKIIEKVILINSSSLNKSFNKVTEVRDRLSIAKVSKVVKGCLDTSKTVPTLFLDALEIPGNKRKLSAFIRYSIEGIMAKSNAPCLSFSARWAGFPVYISKFIQSPIAFKEASMGWAFIKS